MNIHYDVTSLLTAGGGHTQVRLFGPHESTVNWPGRRREEEGSELLAHIQVIQVLPVADNWIDEDDKLLTLNYICCKYSMMTFILEKKKYIFP